MFTFLTRFGRLALGIPIVVATSVIVGFGALSAVPVASRQAGGCSVSPTTVSLDQSYSVSAWKLPTGGTVNLIITLPNGSTLTGPISVASNGTYTLTQSSANAIPPDQTGTYSYKFVGKVKWPQGTSNQSYATCSVAVT